MSEKSASAGGGIGFFSLLGLLFIGLKLGGIINWSWWLILLPLYGPLLLGLVIIAVCLIIAVIAAGIAAIADR